MGSCGSKQELILVLLGSNSSNSIHKAILVSMNSFSVFSQGSLQIVVPNLAELPFFNQDLLNQNKIPNSVTQLIRLTGKSSAIILMTPQYNGAVCSSILNGFQWITQISRQKGEKQSVIAQKPIGMMGCSYISQNQLTDVELISRHCQARLFNQKFYVDLKKGEIDLQDNIISPSLRLRLMEWVKKFIKFTQKYKPLHF